MGVCAVVSAYTCATRSLYTHTLDSKMMVYLISRTLTLRCPRKWAILQLLVSAWDRSTAIDVLGHWLSVMHVHDEGGGADSGCCGGWLPREQILGEEAKRRVPAEYISQVSRRYSCAPPLLRVVRRDIARLLFWPPYHKETYELSLVSPINRVLLCV